MKRFFLARCKAALQQFSRRPVEAWFILTGIGFKKCFTIGQRVIERPGRFWDIEHMKAFEAVGTYVSDTSKWDVLWVFCERFLANTWCGPKLSYCIWREVLEYFIECGVIERRWQLEIPLAIRRKEPCSSDWRAELMMPERGVGDLDPIDRVFVPRHDANGVSLLREPVQDKTRGPQVDSIEFWPEFLTDTQKAALIGKPYRLYFDGQQLPTYMHPDDVVIVEDRHFYFVPVRTR